VHDVQRRPELVSNFRFQVSGLECCRFRMRRLRLSDSSSLRFDEIPTDLFVIAKGRFRVVGRVAVEGLRCSVQGFWCWVWAYGVGFWVKNVVVWGLGFRVQGL
jgi:hypothetical protein